jgi:hypothetical protein
VCVCIVGEARRYASTAAPSGGADEAEEHPTFRQQRNPRHADQRLHAASVSDRGGQGKCREQKCSPPARPRTGQARDAGERGGGSSGPSIAQSDQPAAYQGKNSQKSQKKKQQLIEAKIVKSLHKTIIKTRTLLRQKLSNVSSMWPDIANSGALTFESFAQFTDECKDAERT